MTAGALPAGVLDDVNVLDLSWVVAGPLIGRTLADFGARVVRVESSRRVETARLMPPFAGGRPGVDNSALYGTCNAGKLGTTIDLSRDEGRAIIRDLVDWADVVIESFSPGLMRRWGLDYQTLAADKPGLIMVSTSLMGQTGPLSTLAGFGNIGASVSGFQNLAGWPDLLPLGPFGPYTDYVGPRLALIALLSALERRDLTGAGCYIDISQVEAGVFFLAPQCAHEGVDGTIAQRLGNRDEVHAPHGVYPTADGFVAVAVTEDDHWRRLASELGEEFAADGSLSTAAGRRAAADRLDAAVAAWTTGRTAADVEARLQSLGVPAHRSASPADLVEDPQLLHRNHFRRLPHPLHGLTTVEGPRYLLSGTPGDVRAAAPVMGEHNEYVLRELLGYPAERIAELTERGLLT